MIIIFLLNPMLSEYSFGQFLRQDGIELMYMEQSDDDDQVQKMQAHIDEKEQI